MTLLNSGPLHPILLLSGKRNYSAVSGNLRKKVHFDSDVYEAVYPSRSQPAGRYGIPKMHKPQAPNSTSPFRHMVFSIGTYNYSLAKYLSNLLQPHIPSTFITSDSFTFVKEINDISTQGTFMVSFDVESLFTNIPLEECSNLAIKYNTEGNPGLKRSKDELKRLFEFATKGTHFLFNGTFYDQVDGVAMGSPSPLFSPISLWVTMKIYGWNSTWIQRYYSVVAT